MFCHRATYFFLATPRVPKRDRDILFDSEPWDEAVILKHEPVPKVRRSDALPAEFDIAIELVIETGDQSEQRGFAAAARPYYSHEFAARHVEIDAVEYRRYMLVFRKALADTTQIEFVSSIFR